MFRANGVVVVVPAHDEALCIERAILTMPAFVDLLLIIDDGSTDRTAEIAYRACTESGRQSSEHASSHSAFSILHQPHSGVGRAVYTGFEHVLEMRTRGELARIAPQATDWCISVMDADGQMDPDDLPFLLEPLLDGRVDHVKGDRSRHRSGLKGMPPSRRLGSSMLALLTRLASGYRDINDPQCGYRAVSLDMLQQVDLDDCWEGYGYPNHWLIGAGSAGFRLGQVAVRTLYADELSGLRIHRFLPSVSLMLLRGLWRRGWNWYVRGDGMPVGSAYRRAGVVTGWFSAWIALGLIALTPAHWIGLSTIAITALTMAERIDSVECSRRSSAGSEPPGEIHNKEGMRGHSCEERGSPLRTSRIQTAP